MPSKRKLEKNDEVLSAQDEGQKRDCKVLYGEEKQKYLKIRDRLWELRKEEQKLREELKKMGLEFDIFGKPLNFRLAREDEDFTEKVQLWKGNTMMGLIPREKAIEMIKEGKATRINSQAIQFKGVF